MAVIISATVLPMKDLMGNTHYDVWGLVEFRDATYGPGGENLALGSLLNRVEYMQVTPASGALNYEAQPNMGDYPGNAGSGRLRLMYPGSGSVLISGGFVSLASGQSLSITSASNYSNVLSGRINAGITGLFSAGIANTEVVSGVAVSGVRAQIHALGT